MMRLFALSMLLLITLGFAQNDVQTSQASQASPASADYQAGFARGLELGMEVASLKGAAPFNPEAAELFNQTVLEFNRTLDQVFGQGSSLSSLYRLQLYGLKANNATNLTDEQAAENALAENTTAENAINDNVTADNATADNVTAENVTVRKITPENHTAENLVIKQGRSLKNETINAMNKTRNAKEPAIIPKLKDNATIAVGDSITDDFGDVIKDWDGSSESPPESMGNMPGPETV
ncbi:MAG TPA: hypothetical protein VLB04_01890 [Methanotrichaceae archaeon]|nr:hypothetical protein [Methanotrichaceae archaeon]